MVERKNKGLIKLFTLKCSENCDSVVNERSHKIYTSLFDMKDVKLEKLHSHLIFTLNVPTCSNVSQVLTVVM